MTKFEQAKIAIERHFSDVSFSGYVFCATHIHDGSLNESYAGFIGGLRKLVGVRIEMLIYDPKRNSVNFYGCEKHAKEVSLVMSRKWTLLDWEECPLEPLHNATDYFVDGRKFEGWDYYLNAISDKLRLQ